MEQWGQCGLTSKECDYVVIISCHKLLMKLSVVYRSNNSNKSTSNNNNKSTSNNSNKSTSNNSNSDRNICIE